MASAWRGFVSFGLISFPVRCFPRRAPRGFSFTNCIAFAIRGSASRFSALPAIAWWSAPRW